MPWRSALPPLGDRLMLAHATDDHVTPVADIHALRRLAPEARYHITERGDHTSLMGAPETVEPVAAFLAGA